MSILPKCYIILTQFLIKSQQDFLVDLDSIILKFIWKGKGSRIAKTIIKKKSKVERVSLFNFKTYYIAV